MPFTEPPKALPPPQPVQVGEGLTLLDPQSRRGTGPGLIVVVDDIATGARIEDGIPSPLMKWAEEGYTVVELSSQAWREGSSSDPVALALDKLHSAPKCESNGKGVGVVCYSAGLWQNVVRSVSSQNEVVAAVLYADHDAHSSDLELEIPVLAHLAGLASTTSQIKNGKVYTYPDQSSARFATPYHQDFRYAAEAVSHTRNLAFLKKVMDGPYFDLETLWDEHTYYEFEARNVEHTMNTMVAEPYVNHIPTLTGGIGRKALTEFYTNHFVFSNPEGTALELISRTVGIDRVVDEFIFKLNHNRQVDWLLPGVPPTNKDLAIPFMAVVNVRGDRLYHEHITWDQATALRQAGILPETLPYQGKELRLPVAGTEAVEKMRDKNSVESNLMM